MIVDQFWRQNGRRRTVENGFGSVPESNFHSEGHLDHPGNRFGCFLAGFGQGAISDTVLSFVACAVQHYGNFGAAAALTFVSSFSSSEMLSKIAWCRSAASKIGRVRVRNSHFAALDDVLRGIAVPQNQFTYVN